MTIEISDKEFLNGYGEAVLKILADADDEFVPPLSARDGTTQKDLRKTEKTPDGILKYFEGMKEQKLLVAKQNDELVGFVSFRENYTNTEISQKECPNIYISTLIVSKNGRGHGLTYKMYEKLFDEYKHSNVFTRTWSTNNAHIRILLKFGFEEYSRLENDRSDGIDTVYFKKQRILSER